MGSATYIAQLSANDIQAMRTEKTTKALMEAKKALLGYAVAIDLQGACTTSCARPGDLPCPDIDNDGEAETACGNAAGTTNQVNRLGRLPWKTLGLGDLRDGNGERLWYAVSNNFKNNAKALPLNNDTLGTINITDFGGAVSANATGTTGAVAVIISPGELLTRQDGTQQLRSTANENVAIHYLDNALGEDNADFFDSTTNGFIKGIIRNVTGDIILNDQMMPISTQDMFAAIDAKVLKEVKAAIDEYFSLNSYYPYPASFIDVGCLGTSSLLTCSSILLNYEGRIPATMLLLTPAWQPTSILRAESNNNWFQQNGWREHVYYAVSPACTSILAPNCTGAGASLTLKGAIENATNKDIILLMSGPTLTGQSRSNNAQKTLISNYYESENVSNLNGIFQREIPLTTTFNDSAESAP